MKYILYEFEQPILLITANGEHEANGVYYNYLHTADNLVIEYLFVIKIDDKFLPLNDKYQFIILTENDRAAIINELFNEDVIIEYLFAYLSNSQGSIKGIDASPKQTKQKTKGGKK